MAYQAIPPVTTTLDWRGPIATRIKALNSTLVRMACSSDCTSIAGTMLLDAAAGTGTVVPAASVEGGATRFSSGGTAGGSRVANLGANATIGTQAVNTRTSKWAVYTRAKIVTAVASGAEQAVMCGMIDTTNDNYIGQHASISTTNWVFRVGGGAATDTGVAFDNTAFHDLVIWNDGTTVRGLIDWVQVGSAASSAVATTAGWSRLWAYNAAVTGTVNFDINRWALFTIDP